MSTSTQLWRCIPLLAGILLSLSLGCEKPEFKKPSPLPEIQWEWAPLPLLPSKPNPDLKAALLPLRTPLQPPEALETKLSKDDRREWQEALEHLERFQLHAGDTLKIATSLKPSLDLCDQAPPLKASNRWRLASQRLLQQRRALLWELGRLELASRAFHASLEGMKASFEGERSKHAEASVFSPVSQIQKELERFDTPQTRPDGDWEKAALLPRFARHRPVLELMFQAKSSLSKWQKQVGDDDRWGYLANSAQAPLDAIDHWHHEHEALLKISSSYAKEARSLERIVGRKHDAPAKQCFSKRSRLLALYASAYTETLRAQSELMQAQPKLHELSERLGTSSALGEEVNSLQHEARATSHRLLALEATLLKKWDEVEAQLWESLPEVYHPIDHPTRPSIEDPAQWRSQFFSARDQVNLRRVRANPEPEQPHTKRGKPRPPFVTEALDLVRSPARIAEVEQGLLAISELDAHLGAFHKAIHRACREGACAGLPGASVPYSPRQSPWVEQWRALPVNERSLGHNLLVLELARLHLARQVQHLAFFHAWFSELSSADLNWYLLKDWEQTWSLYTGRKGSYLSFIRAMQDLENTVHALEKPKKNRVVSDRLAALLEYHRVLFELSLDYAAFVDRGGEPPIPVTTLYESWDKLHDALANIETATLKRDEALAKKKDEEKGR